MSLTLRLTGTGGAQLVPVFGCDCAACRRVRREGAHRPRPVKRGGPVTPHGPPPGPRAGGPRDSAGARPPPRPPRREESHRRRPCSGVVTFNSAVTLLDAGRPDLMEHHPAGSFQQVLLTHYHLDHVQGLFPLRWGVGASIPVYGPPDDAGCDDLLKHPGLLDFSHTVTPFVMFNLQGLRVTPLPLNHSKLTFGYLLESAHSRLAWLSDTAGLPDKTLKFLLNNRPQAMIIDCSHEPRAQTPRNHNDLNTVRSLNQVIGCPRVILTHISHQFDVWMMDNPLPTGFEAGYDGMEIALD
ncbi:phosphonate metabolism protein PhnP [Klebsiella pneumoniae]|nr:phosphonate metabolism protein PhnP [Klebsiella pneumoniae]